MNKKNDKTTYSTTNSHYNVLYCVVIEVTACNPPFSFLEGIFKGKVPARGAKYSSTHTVLGRLWVFGSWRTFKRMMAAQQQPTEDEVLSFLRTQEAPLSGKLVGQRMGFQGRKNVNTQLHSLSKKGLVRKDETKQPPEWSVIGGGADGGASLPRPNLSDLNRHVKVEGKELYSHESLPDGRKVFTPVRAGDLSQVPSQALEAESSPRQESGELVLTSPSNPPAAQVPTAHERNQSVDTAQPQNGQGDDDSVNALTENFEGIDLSGNPLDTQLPSAQHEVNQAVVRPIPKPRTRIQPTDEERQAIREYLQQTDVPVTMVELFTRIGHTTRTVAKVIVQELEKEGVVRKIESSGTEPEEWEWVRE